MTAQELRTTPGYGYDSTHLLFDGSGVPIFGCDGPASCLTPSGFRESAEEYRQFTGKERDAESGLDYFGARYYGSALGRFTSPDWSETPQPVPYASLDNPQSLNLYAYLGNNPLSRNDPDGHCTLWVFGNDCGGKEPPPPTRPASAKPPGLAPEAKDAVLAGLDNKKVGNNTVAGLAKTLHNESNGLTGGKPGELENGKTAEANAIINNAEKPKPNSMAPSTGTAPPQDLKIMEQAVYNRLTGGADPVQGRSFFGNSAQDLTSRPIGNSRQTVFEQFGPFTWGNNAPQYIYIYNDPK